jgi:glycine betaine catabolism A
LIWERQWYLTYHYWPTSENTHEFVVSIYFVPPKTPLDRIRQEHTVAVTKEYALQDVNTLEATQRMIETGVVDTFVLNDQEILCRHHHAVVKEYVRANESGTPVSFPWNRSTADA